MVFHGSDPRLYQRLRAILARENLPLPADGLAEKIAGFSAGGLAADSRRIRALAATHPGLLPVDGGRVGLSDWFLRGHRFRALPEEPDFDEGRLPARRDLLYFYLRPGIVRQSRATRQVALSDPLLGWEGEARIVSAGQGESAGWHLEGLLPWLDAAGMEPGDEIVIEVRSYTGLRWTLRREAIRQVDDDQIEYANREVLAHVAGMLLEPGLPREDGGVPILDILMRLLARRVLDYEVPPDPLPGILDQDARFVLDGRRVWLAPEYARLHPGKAAPSRDPSREPGRIDPDEIDPLIVALVREASTLEEAQQRLCEFMVAIHRDERRHYRNLATQIRAALTLRGTLRSVREAGPAPRDQEPAPSGEDGDATARPGEVIGYDFLGHRRLEPDDPCPCGGGLAFGECCGADPPRGEPAG